MTLTVEPKPVKYPRFAWLLWLASLVSVLGTLAFIAANNGAHQQRTVYGQTMADSLALLAREPFVAQDKIQLGLLSQRVAQLPQVAAVTIVDMNEQVLASLGGNPISANPSTDAQLTSSTPVRVDNNLVGYVRIRVVEAAFTQVPTWRHLLFGVLLALGVPVLLLATRHWWLQRRQPNTNGVVAVEFDPEPASQHPQFLIAANLFHRLGLSGEQQQQAQAEALTWAEEIAPLYGGQAEALEQAAVMIRIPDQGQDDGAFAALCAGLLWSRCLTHDCGYRLGVHIEAQPDPATLADSQEPAQTLAQEALLLAAIAANHTVALSAALLSIVPRQERIELQAAQAGLHEDLATVGDGIYQVLGVSPQYEALLVQQAQTLRHKLQTQETASHSS